MARKVGQIIARGDRRWLIRVYLGRDHETKKRNYHNRTIRGSMRERLPTIRDLVVSLKSAVRNAA